MIVCHSEADFFIPQWSYFQSGCYMDQLDCEWIRKAVNASDAPYWLKNLPGDIRPSVFVNFDVWSWRIDLTGRRNSPPSSRWYTMECHKRRFVENLASIWGSSHVLYGNAGNSRRNINHQSSETVRLWRDGTSLRTPHWITAILPLCTNLLRFQKLSNPSWDFYTDAYCSQHLSQFPGLGLTWT